MANVVITLFKPPGDHLCPVDRVIDILEGIVPIKRKMHYEIEAIGGNEYVISIDLACLMKGCWILNGDGQITYSAEPVAFNVDVLITPLPMCPWAPSYAGWK